MTGRWTLLRWLAPWMLALPLASNAASMTKEQGDQILEELKAIHALLEKQAQAAPAKVAPPPPTIKLPDTSGQSLGASDAPVTIVEFTDLQCPYCARFATETFPELRRKYVDTGKVRFVTRDLPLPFHAQALPAAVAARCAGEQGRYWEYREQLFAGQGDLVNQPYDARATEMKLDLAKFKACRALPENTAAAEASRAAANALGINGTPTFVIGRTTPGAFEGEKVQGAQPLATFEAKLDALLAQPTK